MPVDFGKMPQNTNRDGGIVMLSFLIVLLLFILILLTTMKTAKRKERSLRIVWLFQFGEKMKKSFIYPLYQWLQVMFL